MQASAAALTPSIFIAARGVLLVAAMWDLIPWPRLNSGPYIGSWSLATWTTMDISTLIFWKQ